MIAHQVFTPAQHEIDWAKGLFIALWRQCPGKGGISIFNWYYNNNTNNYIKQKVEKHVNSYNNLYTKGRKDKVIHQINPWFYYHSYVLKVAVIDLSLLDVSSEQQLDCISNSDSVQ